MFLNIQKLSLTRQLQGGWGVVGCGVGKTQFINLSYFLDLMNFILYVYFSIVGAQSSHEQQNVTIHCRYMNVCLLNDQHSVKVAICSKSSYTFSCFSSNMPLNSAFLRFFIPNKHLLILNCSIEMRNSNFIDINVLFSNKRKQKPVYQYDIQNIKDTDTQLSFHFFSLNIQ